MFAVGSGGGGSTTWLEAQAPGWIRRHRGCHKSDLLLDACDMTIAMFHF